MNSVRICAAGPAIAGLILLSPILAFLMVISAEILLDLAIGAGVIAVSAITVGALGWALFRRFWQLPDRVRQSGPEVVSDEAAIAAPPT
jgi:hypothetical protein